MLVQHTFVRGSTRLGYGEGPASGPPLVLLHGVLEDRRSFEPLLPSLCVHHHVFALDLRGHGTSDWTPGAYALTDDAEDALALLAERVPPRPALLGHSQGALIGIAVASRIAADLAALVLVDPPLPCLADERASIARVIDLFRSIRALLVDTGGGAAARAALLERIPGEELMADQTSRTDPERIASVIDMSAFEGPRRRPLGVHVGRGPHDPRRRTRGVRTGGARVPRGSTLKATEPRGAVARSKGFDELASELETSASVMDARLANAVDTPAIRDAIAHWVGIERWGQRRLSVTLGAPFIGDGHHPYRPDVGLDVQALRASFAETRAETIALVHRLRDAGVDASTTVLHNDLGALSVRGWITYLIQHPEQESEARIPGARSSARAGHRSDRPA